jgi:predicted nucleotidyltransferase
MDSKHLDGPFAIPVPTTAVAAFCQKWGLRRLELFGSILRTDFKPESDVDILVSFRERVKPTFLAMTQMRAELELLFHRPVDLVRRESIEKARNPYRRRSILESAAVVYED